MSETILVTGRAGYIGSHVVRQLSEKGHRVLEFDNLSTRFADALICGEELIKADLAAQPAIGRPDGHISPRPSSRRNRWPTRSSTIRTTRQTP